MANTKEQQSMTSAVIETGGKQYRVNTGQVIAVEKLESEVGKKITFDKVLLVTEGKESHFGAPLLTTHTVVGEVIEQARGPKIRVFTYKSKKRQHRTLGHRQALTKVKIVEIGPVKAAAAKPAAAKKFA